MEISQIIPHIESLIFAADRPLPLLDILDLLNNALAFLEDRATLEQVEASLEAIKEKYSTEFYAFEVKESGGGYQFLTKKEYYQTVAQLNGDKFLKRLSTAALETLAIVAYKQPISKGEIEHIRGVSTDYSIQKLLEKELIVITGRSENLPGKPLLYATSKAFMDYFGLNSPKDLPKLKEVFDDESIQPTLIGLQNDAETDEDGHNMVVSETGELVEQDTPANEDPQSSSAGNAGQPGPAANNKDGKPADMQAKLFLPFGDEEIPVQDDNQEAGSPDDTSPSPTSDNTSDTSAASTDDAGNNERPAPTMDEALAEEEDTTFGTPSLTPDEQEADESVTYATDEELAAFMESAADLGPKGDDDEDEEEDDEDEDLDGEDEELEDHDDGEEDEDDDDEDDEEDGEDEDLDDEDDELEDDADSEEDEEDDDEDDEDDADDEDLDDEDSRLEDDEDNDGNDDNDGSDDEPDGDNNRKANNRDKDDEEPGDDDIKDEDFNLDDDFNDEDGFDDDEEDDDDNNRRK
ncbi:SMC-Scp complex subunit ScpB [Chitinophaga rhizophila]|uniref:SMC-Scp complex subunit ScpB n=1 Tax=Chitinophaga rhizophila TaxID=2866212 RepID=A0ABS7GLG5_9BACT|nr:SMC-Scp complex subunit ScpB [Chitinophaga rhizophila]MBW8688080.1 SMC-Scp complex subunit ScpB [Chitinophaga rhizophila]